MNRMADEWTLDTAPENREAEVVEISGGWSVRQRVGQMGIRPGANLIVKRAASWGGPVLVEIGGTDLALGRNLAKKIRLRDAAESIDQNVS
jgi:ferrous iron transport protein A